MSEKKTPKIMAGKAAIIGGRYALAMYDLAVEKNKLDAVLPAFVLIKEALCNNSEFMRLAAHPRLTRRQLMDMATKISKVLELDEIVQKFLVLVAHNRRLSLLFYITESFFNLAEKARGEVTAKITSTKALSEEQVEKLSKQLQAFAGLKVCLETQEDPTLLGGLKIKIGSRLIDASIKGKLARVERHLKAQQEAA